MVHSITFKKTFRSYKAGVTFDFKPGVNLLVGDNGTGKSSLIHIFSKFISKYEHDKKDAKEIAKLDVDKCVAFIHDFEKDNVRTQSYFGDNIAFQLGAMFASHGESVKVYIKSMYQIEERGLFVLDEPDMGLSPTSVMLLIDAFKHAEEKGCQIIASVHNVDVMRAFEPVQNMHKLPEIEEKDKKLIVDISKPKELIHVDLLSSTDEYMTECNKRYKNIRESFLEVKKAKEKKEDIRQKTVCKSGEDCVNEFKSMI